MHNQKFYRFMYDFLNLVQWSGSYDQKNLKNWLSRTHLKKRLCNHMKTIYSGRKSKVLCQNLE